jgi:diguanylate cyclase (GGDEF)-like protein
MTVEVAAPPIRLLLVEDSPSDAQLFRATIGRSTEPRFEIHHVPTLGDACHYVDHGPGTDVVVLDLGLPDAAELDGLIRLQDCARDLPIIVLTGHDEELAVSALQRGAQDYLVKGSVDRQGIIRSLRYAMERHRSVRELARVTRELQQANSTLEKLTLIDPLTELLNRRGLQQALSRQIEHVRREGGAVLVLLVDIDDFKQINDKFGHAVGDVGLKEISRKLLTCVRGIDFVARLGGDEFMLLLPRARESEAYRIAERARLAVSTTRIRHGEETISLTVSIGAMMLRPDTPSVDEVLTRAQQLLMRSKRVGKNRVTSDDIGFDDSEHRNLRATEMCNALSSGRNLLTVKQPIYRLSDQSPVGYEFLSRYSNGTLELPDHFFQVCSERNVLTLVDHHCLRRALNAAAKMPPYARFHVNLFPSTLIAIPPEHLLEAFPHPLPAQTYCVEISEQQIIGDPSHLIGPVRALRDAGLLIAIDDVGFGNSCLESLVMLEPDVIKIDKRCVIGLDTADSSRIAHLERYLKVATSFGAEVIAEGIENVNELAIVKSLGIQYGQGFLWGKPA